VTLSYGVATFGADGRTLDDLTKAADEALYTAKRHGPIGMRVTAAAG
jgi:PleD family two-component response regulator